MNGSSHRLILAAALACGLLAQEPGAPFEVTGVVYDVRTSLPIEGATVAASGLGTTSDSRGFFRARVYVEEIGRSLVVSKRGYVYAIVPNLRPGMKELKVGLKPSPEITGQVVDSETGEPVAGITIRISAPGSLSGISALFSMRDDREKTGEDGRFALQFNPSQWGSLLFMVRPPLWAQKSFLLLDPSGKDRAAIDRDYEPLFWPGEATPLNIASGISVDTGVLRLRKTSYYRAHVSFPAGGCEAATKYQAMLFQVSGGIYSASMPLGLVQCGQDFAVRGLLPGSYRIEVTKQEAAAPDRRWAQMDFVIADKSVDLEASFIAGSDLQGRVVAAEGAQLPESLTVMMREIGTRTLGASTEVSPPVNANFLVPNVVLGLKEVLVTNLPPGYVAEVRFRGSALPGDVLRWDGTGSLEVVVDDRGATLTGQVTDGPSALVLVLPWPRSAAVREGEGDLGRYLRSADARGQFTRQGLRAGEYRVLAIPSGQGVRILDPVVQQRLFEQAERVTLGRGSTQTLVLPVLDPAR